MSSPPNSRCAPSPRRTDRGSAIITVLVLAAVTAVIASGFLFRSAQEARLATRAYFDSAALNLAEAGVEEGLYAANSGGLTSANGWSLASGSSTDYVKTVTTGFDFQQATGALYIRVDGPASATPSVTAAGVITIPGQPRLLKQIRVSGTGPRKLFANGVVTKGLITFSGSADIDGYDSSLGPWNAVTNRNDRATVATDSTVQISNNAYVYGYVATNGVTPNVGANGRIYGATSPGTPKVDPTRVRTDFSMNLTDATAPTGSSVSLGNLSTTTTLPRPGDTPGANGRFLYRTSEVELDGSDVLTINGPVDLISDSDATVNGSAKILINSGTGPSLNLYSPGTITINGAGMVNNTGDASKVTIWGTKPSTGTQSMEINGSAAFVGTVYAPNATITMNGAAGFSGAIIGKTLTVAGNSVIHYDTQLANASISGGPTPGGGSTGSGAIAVNAWAELTKKPGSGDAFARDNRQPFNTLF